MPRREGLPRAVAGDDDLRDAFKPSGRGLQWILLRVMPSLITYSAAHLIIHFVLRRTMSQRMAQMRRSDKIFMVEKLMSTVNGIYTGIIGLSMTLASNHFSESVVLPYPDGMDSLFANLCGYSIYDMVTMYLQGDQHFSIWLHHIVAACGTSLMLYYKVASFFPALFSMTEISVLIQNLLWYVDILLGRNSVLYGRLLLARAITFPLLRIWVGPYAFYRALTAPKDGIEIWKRVPPLVTALTVFNVALLSYANVGWSWAMIKIWRRWRSKGKARQR